MLYWTIKSGFNTYESFSAFGKNVISYSQFKILIFVPKSISSFNSINKVAKTILLNLNAYSNFQTHKTSQFHTFQPNHTSGGSIFSPLFYSSCINRSSSPIFCPSSQWRLLIIPSLLAVREFCIFIASTTQISWPSTTVSPTLQFTDNTFPGMGLLITELVSSGIFTGIYLRYFATFSVTTSTS